MRKVIVLEFITLDGVIQAGGGPEEDTSGGFAYGGWEVPYGDDVVGAAITRQMNMPFGLPQWHHYRELRASRRDQNRKSLSRRRVELLKAGSA